MAEVIMTCGRLCSGKSTYAQRMRKDKKAVVLSIDEITLALFKNEAGDMLDEYVERTRKYLYEKSVELIETGINVVLDWGFWTADERQYARGFYGSRGIKCGLHYLDISAEEWQRRIDKRNEAVKAGKCSAYFVDEGLAAKFRDIFEIPSDDEIDVYINTENGI